MPLQQASLDALWDFEDPVSSEAALRQVRELITDPVERAELQTQVARALGMRGRFGEAERMLASIPRHDPVVLTRIELELGRLLHAAGDPRAALPHIRRSIRTARSAGAQFLLIDALHTAATIDKDSADRWFQEAMRELTVIRDLRTQRWIIALWMTQGWRLHDAGRVAEALDAFRAAGAASIRLGTAQQRFAARWAEARCLRSLGRRAEALVIQKALQLQRPQDAEVAAELAILRRHLVPAPTARVA